jgi:hypothetical protein
MDAQALVAELAGRLRCTLSSAARWASKVRAAEISVAAHAWATARRVLHEAGGAAAPTALRAMARGEIRDLRDGVAADACEVAAIRQGAEEELARLSLPDRLEPATEQGLAALIDEESRRLEVAAGAAAWEPCHGGALRTVVDDACRVMRAAAQAAGDAPTASLRKDAGAVALLRVEEALRRWLDYEARLCRKAPAPAADPPPLTGETLTAGMAACPRVRDYVLALRRCFALRRQQVALEGWLLRAQAACDALDRLACTEHCFPDLSPAA